MARFTLVLSGVLGLSGGSTAAEQWIVATAPAFKKALEPLCAQRKAQGYQVHLVQTTDVLSAEEIRAGKADKLRDHLHKLCRTHDGPSSILLVGAVEAGGSADPEQTVLPALRGSIGHMKGQPSDNGYGCPDGGRLSTVPVGRLPARSADEALGMVQKILAFENDKQPGRWRRRLVVLAGVPAYNPVVDRLVETLAFARIDRLSPAWSGAAIYSNPTSRFCVPDPLLRGRALKYVEQGEAFILYLGHSNPSGLYGGRAAYLSRTDWSQLRIGRGRGVFFTFGCNGCQLSGPGGEGYGVAAVRNPNGPVAAAGSHGICFAALVQLASDGLFDNTFARHPPERLGACWLAIKKGLAQGTISDFSFRMLDAVDGDSSIPLAEQRQEHLEMFVLLGDPALRLPKLAEDVELTVADTLQPGGKLHVRGKLPARLAGARVRLTLERTVGSTPVGLEELPPETGPQAERREKVMLANHERANQFVLCEQECTAGGRDIDVTLDVPGKLPWQRVILRAYAATKTSEGQGVVSLRVSKAPPGKGP
jgi:hypothetical protein